MKRVLMIAYHFPPLAGSSGIQRTLRFVQHLPSFGWEPIVISAAPMAYENTNDDLLSDIPPGTIVRRPLAFDAARHLSLGGRYLGCTARPDRWVSWKFAAVHEGLRLIKKYRPSAIWSTYPIATAHLIGSALHRKTGIPWYADFRDPMAQDGYPADPRTWQSFRDIESDAIHNARFSLFTTPGAACMYRERYPKASERIVVLENGYDEESFADAGTHSASTTPINPGCVTLLHSGIVYPEERDPTQLFAALARLKQHGELTTGRLKVRFRASVHDDLLNGLANEYGVAEFIECCPALPYRQALSEMLRADGLLVMQASNCNEQIPAKLYEYLRANRPILGLTDPAGDTARTLMEAGVSAIAPLDSEAEISDLLKSFVAQSPDLRNTRPDTESVKKASRKERAAVLAELLDQ